MPAVTAKHFFCPSHYPNLSPFFQLILSVNLLQMDLHRGHQNGICFVIKEPVAGTEPTSSWTLWQSPTAHPTYQESQARHLVSLTTQKCTGLASVTDFWDLQHWVWFLLKFCLSQMFGWDFSIQTADLWRVWSGLRRPLSWQCLFSMLCTSEHVRTRRNTLARIRETGAE